MPMYKLLEYSENYRKTTGTLWHYYRDEPNNPPATDYNADPITNSESEKHQMQIKTTVKTLSDEMQRLRKILELLFH